MHKHQEHIYKGNKRFNDSVFFSTGKAIETGIAIKHFCVSRKDTDDKFWEWYREVVAEGKGDIPPPSQFPQFKNWKKLNPKRDDYR